MEGVGEVGMVVRLMVKEFTYERIYERIHIYLLLKEFMRKLGRSEVGFESENL